MKSVGKKFFSNMIFFVVVPTLLLIVRLWFPLDVLINASKIDCQYDVLPFEHPNHSLKELDKKHENKFSLLCIKYRILKGGIPLQFAKFKGKIFI